VLYISTETLTLVYKILFLAGYMSAHEYPKNTLGDATPVNCIHHTNALHPKSAQNWISGVAGGGKTGRKQI
jgi:hypothetical protein